MFVTGRGWNGDNQLDILTIKLAAADGEVVWSDFYGGASRLDDTAWDIVIGPDGHPIVTGFITATGGQAFFWTGKLDSADGHHLWDWEELGAVDNIDARSGWLAALPDGDVVMVNRTWESGTGFDIVVHRYAAADGWPVYLERYNTGGNTPDEPRDLMVGPGGDLIVCGVTGGDYLVARFDPATGLAVWDATYAGPPDWYDVAATLAMGPGGEVLASGFSDGDGSGWDVATVAFDPDDGSVLWDVRWASEVAWGSDEGRDIAVSAQGDIYVVGYTYGSGGDTDMLSLRYLASDVTPVDGDPAVPSVARLTGAWPNPFNPRVNVDFALPRDGAAHLAVHDLTGRQVAVLRDGVLPAGSPPGHLGRPRHRRPHRGGRSLPGALRGRRQAGEPQGRPRKVGPCAAPAVAMAAGPVLS